MLDESIVVSMPVKMALFRNGLDYPEIDDRIRTIYRLRNLPELLLLREKSIKCKKSTCMLKPRALD